MKPERSDAKFTLISCLCITNYLIDRINKALLRIGLVMHKVDIAEIMDRDGNILNIMDRDGNIVKSDELPFAIECFVKGIKKAGYKLISGDGFKLPNLLKFTTSLRSENTQSVTRKPLNQIGSRNRDLLFLRVQKKQNTQIIIVISR